jgi:hypothetical protein
MAVKEVAACFVSAKMCASIFPMKMKLRTKPLSETQELVMLLYTGGGMTYQKIGDLLGVTRERVRQIYTEARRRLAEHEEDPRESLVLLPVRVRTLFRNLDLHSRSQVLAAFRAGAVWCDSGWWAATKAERARLASGRNGWNLGRMRNFGKGSWLILEQWLGFRTAKEQQQDEKKRMEASERKRLELVGAAPQEGGG